MISGKKNDVWGVVGVLILVDWFLLLSFHPRTVDSTKFPFFISEEGEGGGEDLVCRGRAV